MPESSTPRHPPASPDSVLADILAWRDQGKRVWLCTIVGTWGSSPRPRGSWLAVSEAGDWSGSVSGGCLEEDLLRRTASDWPERALVIDYGITDDDRDRFSLPCGGRIRLLVEPVSGPGMEAHIRALAQALEQRQPVTRRVCLHGEAELLRSGHRGGALVRFDGECLHHVLEPDCRLLLIGAGDVARYVAEFADAAGFRTTLCEPREAFASGWTHSHIPLDRRLPDDLIAAEFSDAWSGVLALAHDPRIDDMGLLAALASPAFYVGAMGSRKTSEVRRERLASLGLPAAALARLKAPIGVDIPSKTPPEIAISIVADLIAARYRLRAVSASL